LVCFGKRFSIVNVCSLTPELTGAGGPLGPQGTNIGHQNREAMANVGVRVERLVRQQRWLSISYFQAPASAFFQNLES
jgi:hypothetical protein